MEEFFQESPDKQQKVFQLMGVIGINNTDIAYYLMKDANWNLDVAILKKYANAINNFLGEAQPAPYIPPYVSPLTNQPSDQYQPFDNSYDEPTFEQKKQAFDEMFPQLHLGQQVSELNHQRMKKASEIDEQKLNKYIDKLEENKQFGEKLRKSNRAFKNNKAFIMYLNEHYKTKIRFSFGSFISNLALAFLRKKPLLVYVHNQQSIAEGLLTALLQDQAITSYINKNFIVLGIFDNSNDYELIAKDLPIKQLPGIACYSYDQKKNTQNLLGAHKLIDKDPSAILKFLQELVNKYYAIHPLHIQKQVKQGSLKKPEKKQIKKEQQGNRHNLIDEQNELYKKMEEQFKMKREISKLNKEQIQNQKDIIEKNKALFEKQPNGLPNGNTLKRKFDKDDKIEQLFMYVYCFGSENFENKYGQFDLIQTYPPLNLTNRKNQKIAQVFEDSNRENLIVREK